MDPSVQPCQALASRPTLFALHYLVHNCFGSCNELAVDMLLTKHHAVITHFHAQQASIGYINCVPELLNECYASCQTTSRCFVTLLGNSSIQRIFVGALLNQSFFRR